MRKILYISGTRADYGLIRETLFSITKNPKLKIEIIATGMHLMPEFGKTIKEIRKDKFKVYEVNSIYKGDSKESMVDFIGKLVQLLNKKIKKIKPDLILLLGDRGEMLAGAVVGAYLTIPIAHIHGGDVTSTVDELSRHAITKLSHIHFAATQKSAERIKKMGEDGWRIFKVGAPGLDDIFKEKIFTKAEIFKKYNLNSSSPVLLVIQHPTITSVFPPEKQIKETMEAVKELGYQTILIYPNADAGGRRMIKIIEKYRKYPFVRIYKSISRKDCLSLMKTADVMVGNSSSGIIEAPSFCLPMVNVGEREKDRERANNVIDVNYQKEKIKKAIKKAIFEKKFRKKIKKTKNPYGKGRAGEKIADILSNIKINSRLLEKRISY